MDPCCQEQGLLEQVCLCPAPLWPHSEHLPEQHVLRVLCLRLCCAGALERPLWASGGLLGLPSSLSAGLVLEPQGAPTLPDPGWELCWADCCHDSSLSSYPRYLALQHFLDLFHFEQMTLFSDSAEKVEVIQSKPQFPLIRISDLHFSSPFYSFPRFHLQIFAHHSVSAGHTVGEGHVCCGQWRRQISSAGAAGPGTVRTQRDTSPLAVSP